MSRTHKHQVHAETIAPWAALSVILLLWWAGARTVSWIRPHSGAPAAAAHAALDAGTKEPVITAPRREEATLSADVSVTGADIAELRDRNLLIPVKDVSATALVSSFADARSGHTHEAIDILAPRGTDVLAVEGGRVEKFFLSDAGGLTIYQFDPSRRFVYYYAHLDGYAPGLEEGDDVKRGEVIGFVGTTGNAPKDTPHLHFAISKLGPDHRWWGGAALDPFLVWRDPLPN